MQEQSRVLENEWTKLAGGHASAIGTTHLRAIDAQLQAAYDRGAGTEELSPLWQRRNRALRGLIDALRNGIADRDGSLTQI
jgi:HPt (histidine-containing phosphotransfer) domain-containing protein